MVIYKLRRRSPTSKLQVGYRGTDHYPDGVYSHDLINTGLFWVDDQKVVEVYTATGVKFYSVVGHIHTWAKFDNGEWSVGKMGRFVKVPRDWLRWLDEDPA